MESQLDWLANIAVGSEVAIPGRYGSPPTIACVVRLTPTQIVVGHSRYKRSNGRSIGGDSWTSHSIRMPLQSDREIAEGAGLRSRIVAAAQNSKTSLEVLRAMGAALAYVGAAA